MSDEYRFQMLKREVDRLREVHDRVRQDPTCSQEERLRASRVWMQRLHEYRREVSDVSEALAALRSPAQVRDASIREWANFIAWNIAAIAVWYVIYFGVMQGSGIAISRGRDSMIGLAMLVPAFYAYCIWKFTIKTRLAARCPYAFGPVERD